LSIRVWPSAVLRIKCSHHQGRRETHKSKSEAGARTREKGQAALDGAESYKLICGKDSENHKLISEAGARATERGRLLLTTQKATSSSAASTRKPMMMMTFSCSCSFTKEQLHQIARQEYQFGEAAPVVSVSPPPEKGYNNVRQTLGTG
jgi:hypothetical protein